MYLAGGKGSTFLEIISGKGFRSTWKYLIITFFLLFVILPTIWILSYAVTNWGDIQMRVFDDPAMRDLITSAIVNSFAIAGIVTLIDILVGLPMAWLLVRKDFRGKKLLDTLIDMPLAVPTAALGFS